MAKNVFRYGEFTISDDKVQIAPPEAVFPQFAKSHSGRPAKVEDLADLDEVEAYDGPTADDLRREAEAFKTQWEQEKAQMIADAQAEAEKIVSDAEAAAFEEMRKKTEAAQEEKRQADQEAEAVRTEAKAEAEKIISEAREMPSTSKRKLSRKDMTRAGKAVSIRAAQRLRGSSTGFI
jgi:flagellar assembly protein FliH